MIEASINQRLDCTGLAVSDCETPSLGAPPQPLSATQHAAPILFLFPLRLRNGSCAAPPPARLAATQPFSHRVISSRSVAGRPDQTRPDEPTAEQQLWRLGRQNSSFFLFICQLCPTQPSLFALFRVRSDHVFHPMWLVRCQRGAFLGVA